MSVAEQIVLDVLTGGRPIVRNMRPGETIPEEFEIGLDKLGSLNPYWIWVVERYGKIEGCIVASEFHGLAFVWRVAMSPTSPKTCLRKLMARAIADCKQRGIKGMMTMLDPENETQMRLKKIMEKWGGKVTVPQHEIVAAALPEVF